MLQRRFKRVDVEAAVWVCRDLDDPQLQLLQQLHHAVKAGGFHRHHIARLAAGRQRQKQRLLAARRDGDVVDSQRATASGQRQLQLFSQRHHACRIVVIEVIVTTLTAQGTADGAV